MTANLITTVFPPFFDYKVVLATCPDCIFCITTTTIPYRAHYIINDFFTFRTKRLDAPEGASMNHVHNRLTTQDHWLRISFLVGAPALVGSYVAQSHLFCKRRLLGRHPSRDRRQSFCQCIPCQHILFLHQ